MNFATANDPRVPVCVGGTTACSAIGVTQNRRDDLIQPIHVQMLWTTQASPVNIMKGIEARLIEAEAQLRVNNPSGLLATLNAARATMTGLTPLTDPGTAVGRENLLFRERAFWLFASGHRVGDLRRLIRQYNRTENTVFPTGAWHKGGNYGSDVTVPVSQAEQNNPNVPTSVEDNVGIVPYGGKQIVDYGVAKIEAPGAWALGYRGQGVKVGIFDSGIDIDHPDLRVVGGIDLVGDGRGLDDCNGHGTHVAGIVGARDNSKHTVGVAPSAELYAMRLADCAWAGGTLAKMIQGLEWAIDNGMDVINMSFGFGIQGVSVPTLVPPSAAADAAFDQADQAGIVLVAASGNSSTPYVGYPASHSAVIAVGATDEQDALASFSQFGTDQEVTAPGVNNLASYLVGQGVETTLLVRTDNDRELEAIPLLFSPFTAKQGITTGTIYVGLGSVVEFGTANCTGKTALVTRGGPTFAQKVEEAMNAGCVAVIIHNNQPGNFNGTLGTETTSDGRAWIPAVSISLDDGLYLKNQIESKPTTTSLFNLPGNLAMLSGTSMASPHAAGVAALIRSKYPDLAPADVRAILRNTAQDLGAPGWDPVFGYGRINARRAVQ